MIRLGLAVCCTLASCLTLAACDDGGEPTGQVLVSVGGKDVTRRDVATQMDGAQGGPGQALEAVIQRELLLRIAKRRRLDVTPEYLGQVRQARDEILSAHLENAVAAGLQPPTDQEAATFVNANPAMFAQRMRIRANYSPAETGNAKTTRQNDIGRLITIDTAVVSPMIALQLLEAAPGDQIRMERDGKSDVVTIIDQVATPVSGEQALEVARQVIKRQRLDAALAVMVAEERARTAIRYQAGKGPSAK